MKIQLLSGSFVQSKLSAGDSSNKKFVDKDCMLVYEGAFESMDGPVEVTGEQIEKLFSKYVERMGTAKLASGEPDMRKCAPIQLDHSTAATHTVGRLIGMNSVGEHEGKKALFGRVRILGQENVEKVEDGRWTHVSIGADLEDGEISELTITPFPAAANASLLAKLRSVYVETYRGHKFEVIAAGEREYDIKIPSLTNEIHGPFRDINAAKKGARDMIDDLAELSAKRMSRLKKFDYKGRKVTTFKGPDGYGYAVQDPNDRWMDVDGFDTEEQAVKDAKEAIDEADGIKMGAGVDDPKIGVGDKATKERFKEGYPYNGFVIVYQRGYCVCDKSGTVVKSDLSGAKSAQKYIDEITDKDSKMSKLGSMKYGQCEIVSKKVKAPSDADQDYWHEVIVKYNGTKIKDIGNYELESDGIADAKKYVNKIDDADTRFSKMSRFSEPGEKEFKYKGYTISVEKLGTGENPWFGLVWNKSGKKMDTSNNLKSAADAERSAKETVDEYESQLSKLMQTSDGKVQYGKHMIQVFKERMPDGETVYSCKINGSSRFEGSEKAYSSRDAAVNAAKSVCDSGAKMSKLGNLETTKKGSYRGIDYEIFANGNSVMFETETSDRTYSASNINEAMTKIKKIIDDGLEENKLSKGASMNKDKMKKYLMEEKKMSEKEADKHLKKLEKDEEGSAALSAEVDEHEKKMSAAEADPTKMSEEADPTKMSEEDEEKEKLSEEEEEKEKLSAEADPTKMSDEEDEEKKKLSDEDKENEEKLSGEADPTKMKAMKAKIIALAGKIKTSNTKIQLEAKKAKLSARLSSLRKEGKISPAELKGFNIDEMASLDDKSADVMFSTLSKLSKRIDFDFKGTVEAEDVSQVAAVSKQLRLKRLEIETRLNMPSKAKKAKEELKALIEEEKHLAKKMGETEIHIDTTPHEHNDIHASADEEMSKMCALMDEGKKDDFKKALKSFMDRCRAKHMTTGESDEKRMSSIAKDIQTLQNDYKELVSLVGESFGVKSEDLI